jgi:hypothetical protein
MNVGNGVIFERNATQRLKQTQRSKKQLPEFNSLAGSSTNTQQLGGGGEQSDDEVFIKILTKL